MSDNVIYLTLKTPPPRPAHVEISGGIQHGPVATHGATGVTYDFTNAGKPTYQVALIYADGGVEWLHIDASYPQALTFAASAGRDYCVPVIDMVAAGDAL